MAGSLARFKWLSSIASAEGEKHIACNAAGLASQQYDDFVKKANAVWVLDSDYSGLAWQAED